MAEITTTNLELKFKNSVGKAKTVSVKEPRAGIDRATAEAAVNQLVNADIFVDESGDAYAVGVGARYVQRTVNDIYSVEDGITA